MTGHQWSLVTIVGARPQFIKASAVSPLLRQHAREVLVHTGQHYDSGMSDVFFDELGIPAPDVNLQVGSGGHGAQTGAMLAGIEEVLLRERPDWVLVYGDTNSTLAGALAAAKLHIPVAHVEAGLRSFNRRMPEEINRVLTDHLAALLYAPSDQASHNLAAEGVVDGVHVVGDVMLDTVLLHSARAAERSPFPGSLGFRQGDYYLATIHRAENTDDAHRLQRILDGLSGLDRPVILPMHPRTRHQVDARTLRIGAQLRIIEPVGYLDMLRLESHAAGILTDSGGVQKEAYFLGVPCVTLRPETEWVETIEAGWNRLAEAEPAAIAAAVAAMTRPASRPPLYGEPGAAQRIVDVLMRRRG